MSFIKKKIPFQPYLTIKNVILKNFLYIKENFLLENIELAAERLRTNSGPVTKIENIKTDTTKILRPTHYGE